MRYLPLTLLLTGALAAQSVVVPNANETVRGTAQLNSIIRNLNNPRSYQCGINAAELAGIPIGSVLTGISLRFSVLGTNTASWPPADVQWNDYDIYVGPANPTATWTGDPSLNFAGQPVLVRSGPMVLDAGSFSNTSPTAPLPNAWSEFYFDFQVPYLYLGGDLAMLFSHPGSTDPALALYPETVVSNAATYGVGRSQSIYPAGTASTATTFYVMRVHYGYGVGCAGSSGTAPVLVQSGNTTGGLGGTIRLQVGNMPASSLAALMFGFGPTQIPLGNGCTVLLANSFATVFGISNHNGRYALPVPVPAGLLGGFEVQGAIFDPNTPVGYALTNAVTPQAL